MDPFRIPAISAEDALRAVEKGVRLVDVRKPAARQDPEKPASGQTLPGAILRNPFDMDHSDPLIRADGPIFLACVHGHEVSQFATALLLLHGKDARYVAGGFEALIAAGAQLIPLSTNEEGDRH
ncbi:MAG: rhodanese-like domain-containing protein [Pseudomonadota bacterium]